MPEDYTRLIGIKPPSETPNAPSCSTGQASFGANMTPFR